MTTETIVSQEQKEKAAAALIPFLDKTLEMVLTPTLHIFVQPDGLHIAYYGGQKLGFVLNGNLYALEIYAEESPARKTNGFIQKAFEVLKRAFKIQGAELPEADFYYDYTKHMESYLPEEMQGIGAITDNMDVAAIGEKALEKILADNPLYAEFLEWKTLFPNGFDGVTDPELKKALLIPEIPGQRKIAKAPPIILESPNEVKPPVTNNIPRNKPRRPAKKAAKKKSAKKK